MLTWPLPWRSHCMLFLPSLRSSSLRHRRSHQLADPLNEGLISDRFLHKRDTLRQVSRRRMRLPGDGEHAHLRPALLHKSGKLEAIEGAGHVDVSQHSGDFGSPTKMSKASSAPCASATRNPASRRIST